MAAADDNKPVIIRRKKVMGGDGHHGGAWKVAYADFVTAMMAFFLLLWLLNSTSQDQKKGIADYFDSRVPIVRATAGGDGVFGGEVMRSTNDRISETGGGRAQLRSGRASGDGILDNDPQGAAPPPVSERVEREETALAAIQSAFEALSGESEAADPVMRHVRVRLTDEGLVIDLFDTDGRPLFAAGSAEPSPTLKALVEMVASVARLVENPVALAGHTDASPFTRDGDDANWDLSADRAQAARRLLTASGVSPERIARVSGKAATEPMVAENPADPSNRRVEIILMRTAS